MTVVDDVFRFDATLTLREAAAVRRSAEQAVARGTRSFDLSAVRTVDSAALVVLIAIDTYARARDITICFSGVPNALKALVRLYDADTIVRL